MNKNICYGCGSKIMCFDSQLFEDRLFCSTSCASDYANEDVSYNEITEDEINNILFTKYNSHEDR